MATTTWIAGSGDWNTASNWSNGVPGAADTAVFVPNKADYNSGFGYIPGFHTITGNGPAASLVITQGDFSRSFAGTHVVGTLTATDAYMGLLGGSALVLGSGTLSNGAGLDLQAGATLSGGALTLDEASVSLTSGVLATPLVIEGSAYVEGEAGTLSGLVSGTGSLYLSDAVVLGNPGNTYSGGTLIEAERMLPRVEIGAGTAAGTGPVDLGSGTLTLDRGAVVGPITVASAILGPATINAADQNVTVFAGHGGMTYNNGSGHPTIVGALQPGSVYGQYQPLAFGSMTVEGGTGSVTVFGGNMGGSFRGGAAGNNLLFGGADLSGYPPVENGGYFLGGGAYVPAPVTMFGGGDNDLLVAGGTDNSDPSGASRTNTLVAAGGRETLTGSGSTGRDVFFGGSGQDVIAAGAGAGTVVAGTGAATISGGAGTAAIFAGGGTALILGGTGADYVQAGTGNATLFVGAGADLIGAVLGQSGGSLTVSGFRAGTDRLDLQGYGGGTAGIASGQGMNGNTLLTLVDGTHITLLGVASIGAGSLV